MIRKKVHAPKSRKSLFSEPLVIKLQLLTSHASEGQDITAAPNLFKSQILAAWTGYIEAQKGIRRASSIFSVRQDHLFPES